MHEQRLPDLQPAALQRVEGGGVVGPEGSGLGEVDALRQPGHAVRAGDDPLDATAPGEDGIAALEVPDAGTDLRDPARGLPADHEGQIRFHLVPPGDHEEVGVADPADFEVHRHLALAGAARVFDLAYDEVVGGPERFTEHAFHAVAAPFPMPFSR